MNRRRLLQIAAAIRVADYMISNGQLHRWTCAYITGTSVISAPQN
jgi:hypothetical protein